MAPRLEVRRRRQEAEQRRRERIEAAETPSEQLAAAYDYFRAGMASGKPEDADRTRREVASQLIQITDQFRKQQEKQR